MRLAFERWHSAPQTSRDLVMRRPLVRKVRTDKVYRIVRASPSPGPALGSSPALSRRTSYGRSPGVIAASEADLSRRIPFAPEVLASNRETTWCLTSIIATGSMLSFAPTGL
jgi:hypothetical protein